MTERSARFRGLLVALELSLVAQALCGCSVISHLFRSGGNRVISGPAAAQIVPPSFSARAPQPVTVPTPDGGTAIETSSGGMKITQAPSTVAWQDLLYEYLPATNLSGAHWTADGLPAWASFDSSSGKISGYPDAPGSSDLSLTGTVSATDSVTLKYTLVVKGDPLALYAWHLNNRGQSVFSKTGGKEGEDLGVLSVLRSGFTGKGIRVAISDTGVEIGHEDLKNNITPGQSRDYGQTASATNGYAGGDPTPPIQPVANAHGTAVAGIIGAEAWNGVGSRGIAPNVSLVGFNFLLHQAVAGAALDQITSYESQPNAAIDIFNQSWGNDDFAYVPIATRDPMYLAQLEYGVTHYRNGKGAIYVRAAGNGNGAYQALANGSYLILSNSPANGDATFLTQNANAIGDNAAPYTLVVAGVNANGMIGSYSSPGPAIWVSGLGGEFGDKAPAILTSDRSGCDTGYSRQPSVSETMRNLFEYGAAQAIYNPRCNYTSTMNGTSAAAASVAGVVALMLEANPQLTWRDVMMILAKTATQVQPNLGDIHYDFDIANHVSEPGWITNKAGYHFQNWYGFGRVDAAGAVAMAKTYQPSTSALQNVSITRLPNAPIPIPDKSLNGAPDTMTVNIPANPKIFTVLVHFTSDHPMPAELAIELTAPSGTRSLVLNDYNSFVGNDLNGTTLKDAIFRTNAFLGETTNGDWILKVIDAANLKLNQVGQFVDILESTPPHTGSVVQWKLDFYF